MTRHTSNVSSLEMITALQRDGFIVTRKRKHIRLAKGGCKLSIPHHQSEMSRMLVLKVLKEAGLSVAAFQRLRGKGAD